MLFTPNEPYLLTLVNASPSLSLKCVEAVSCERRDNTIYVKLLRVGQGQVVIKNRRVYGSTEWTFDFIIVEPEDLVVVPRRTLVQEGEQLNITVYNMYQG